MSQIMIAKTLSTSLSHYKFQKLMVINKKSVIQRINSDLCMFFQKTSKKYINHKCKCWRQTWFILLTCRRTMALILYQPKLPPKLEFFFWQIKRRFWQLLKFGSKIKTNLHYKNDSQLVSRCGNWWVRSLLDHWSLSS